MRYWFPAKIYTFCECKKGEQPMEWVNLRPKSVDAPLLGLIFGNVVSKRFSCWGLVQGVRPSIWIRVAVMYRRWSDRQRNAASLDEQAFWVLWDTTTRMIIHRTRCHLKEAEYLNVSDIVLKIESFKQWYFFCASYIKLKYLDFYSSNTWKKSLRNEVWLKFSILPLLMENTAVSEVWSKVLIICWFDLICVCQMDLRDVSRDIFCLTAFMSSYFRWK